MNGIDGEIEILSVKEFTQQLRFLIDEEFSEIWLSGEISNFKDHLPSGHAYFSLKDDQAVIRACLFKPHRMKVKFGIDNGLKVTAHGRIDVYPKRGEYQIIIDYLIPEGIGSLQLAFNQLKERLAKEGIFDQEHKKEIPAFPERVGIITSPTGAALRDILNVMNRRFSNVDILIYPAQVQGDHAGKDIAKKIELANQMGLVDVLIVGRGGGSIEDLWAFNEECVAKAIFNSTIPIISSVGHEVDFTIADFVADLRAPTPSAAAELVVENKEIIIDTLNQLIERLENRVNSIIEISKEKVNRLSQENLNRLFSQQLTHHQMTLDHLLHTLSANMQTKLNGVTAEFNLLYEKLSTLGPTAILKRGYSIVHLLTPDGKKVITQSKKLKQNDQIEIVFYKGSVKAQVMEE